MPKNPHADFSPVLKGYSGQSPFKFWCQMALPLTYDDSLSYYELLNKVVSYLNNTISDVANAEDNVGSLLTSFTQLQDYVNNYFDNLDIEQELRNVLDKMALDGTLDEILSPLIAEQLPDIVEEQIGGVVASQIDTAVAGQIDDSVEDLLPAAVAGEVGDWLDENLEPTSPPVDPTLSIANAAADAKKTGDVVADLKTQIINCNSYDAMPQLKNNTIHNGINFVFNSDNTITISGITGTSPGLYTFFSNANNIPDWMQPGKLYHIKVNTEDENIRFIIYRYDGSTVPVLINTNTDADLSLDNDYNVGMIIRLLVRPNSTVNATIKYPEIIGSISNDELSETIKALSEDFADEVLNKHLFAVNYSAMPIDADTDDYTENGGYICGTPNNISHLPVDNITGLLRVYRTNNIIIQIMLWNVTISPKIATRRKVGTQAWSAWKQLPENVTYNITNNTAQNTITNNYNDSISPIVTTDSHNWLTPDGSNDMTAAILAMLNSTGYCKLSPGTFYVSGNIDMPANSCIEGCGKNTIIRYIDSVASGYVVKMTSGTSIHDLAILGGSDLPEHVYDEENVNYGSRDCIYIGANTQNITIYNVDINNFDGSGIHLYNTGGYTHGTVQITDTYIRGCMIGLNIERQSEYNKFEDLIVTICNIGCVNNGGNNIFSGCTFGGVRGFVMDNSAGNKPNTGHGSCVGCTFNHINQHNNPEQLGMGDAITIHNIPNGFVFTGCQLWYGEIRINESRGIAFSDCQIGGNTPEISVYGTYPAFFDGCIFHAAPTITGNGKSKFNACYVDNSDGTAITG